MASEGPWGRATADPPAVPKPARRSGPIAPLLLLVVGIAALVWALHRAFPEAVQTRDEWSDVAYYAGFLVLLAGGAWRLRRGALGEHLRSAAIWIGVAAVVALGYAYRDELSGVGQHLRLAFGEAQPIRVGDHELVIPQDDRGAFEVIGKVDGQRVRFMIDTGSTDTVLTPDDARRLGIDPTRLDYVREAETANGKGYGAPFVGRLQVGPITLDRFPMEVNKTAMSRSLLGMSFLGRLKSFEIRGRKLYLEWKDAPAA